MWYGIEGWPGWWMPFMGLGMMLFWGAVIGLVVWVSVHSPVKTADPQKAGVLSKSPSVATPAARSLFKSSMTSKPVLGWKLSVK